MRYEIEIIPSYRIDHVKWNACIQQSFNGLIYASAEYLDHVADNWTGIVVNDYEAVMPVPWRKKFGIRYTYDVPFIQQLGLFGNRPELSLNNMLPHLFRICSYGDYHFNFANCVSDTADRTNFILSLNSRYEDIEKGFSHDVRQNILKASRSGLVYSPASIDEAVDVFQQLYRKKLVRISDVQFQNFRKICKLLDGQGKVFVKKAVDQNSTLMAIALFLKDQRRIYNMMNSTLPQGKVGEANYFLLTNVLREFQQSGLVFDFEGSDIPGIQTFYKKFGATNQLYFRLHFNNLAWPLRAFKR